ncbi:MAG: aldo/keto reductase [Candidatus Poribacteria bacterium]
MEYRCLGRTGLKVSEMCLGTMTFGTNDWGIDENRSRKIFNLAIEAGINFFDTANSYADGRSEQILGKLIREKGNRDKLVVATKVFNPIGHDINDSGTSRRHIVAEIENSLQRLQTDYIDLYQVHHVDRETPAEERLRALDDLIHQGKVRYIGCSNEYAWRLCDALWISEIRNFARYESLQPKYNLLTRDIEEEILPLCKEKEIGVIVWGPLAAGYLTGKYKPNQSPPEDSRLNYTQSTMDDFLKPQIQQTVETLDGIAKDLDKSMAEVALRWILDQDTITSVIVGATKVEQIRSNVGCSGWQLDKELLLRLSEVSSVTPRYPHSMAGHMHLRRSDAVNMPTLKGG